MNNSQIIESLDGSEIAIIGMACRFPGAKNLREYWTNLIEGKESITLFTDEELLKAGVDGTVLKDHSYVKAGSILEDYDKFDAGFFGYSPQEAQLMDPQHRVFIECVWEAFEDAGYNPESYKGEIGAFSGAKTDTYLLNIAAVPDYLKYLDTMQVALGNDLGCLSTRLAYKFNLKGPSYAIHTACSTSLVAVHLACQSLLIAECQMAVAGGVTINVPHKTGYFYQPGGVASPDGHCRAFDAQAGGTVFGNGAGAVVLKRLEDAIHDGDNIYAVIKGSAVNNDGSRKASFTAPGVEGQTKVVLEAMASAGVEADTISYVEAHGTGTNLGDPIELTALTNAFRASTDRKGYCAIGSVKTNIGHLDAASGIASLIKTALSIKNGMLPPSLNYSKPNPKIDFDNSPFYVNTRLSEWKNTKLPVRAGVSSFGFGSTNAHVILEEAPKAEAVVDKEPCKLLLLSARSEAALEESTCRLTDYLKQNPQSSMADIAYTLKVGRKVFGYRKMVVCKEKTDAVELLEAPDSQEVLTGYEERSDKSVIFMFPGQGAQYVDMARELYESEQEFRKDMDRCAEILKPYLGKDIRSILFPGKEVSEAAAAELNQTYMTQPVLFSVEYALAKLFIKWGIKPKAMIGHSLGEYVAACLAGVLSLEDALLLVAQRGQLMQSLPGGAMLSVSLSEKQIEAYLNEDISMAAANSPVLTVVSGTFEAVGRLEQQLQENNIQCRRLHTSHAFHSEMIEPILEKFAVTLKSITFNKPKIPYISNVTGEYIKDLEPTQAEYWTKHLRGTVSFSAGIQQLLKESGSIFLEIGPGQTLSTFVRQNESEDSEATILNSLRHPKDQRSDMSFLMTALGKLWLCGAGIDWNKYYENKRQKRVSLPTYPFERQRYWVEALDRLVNSKQGLKLTLDKTENISQWFYEPVWSQSELQSASKEVRHATGTDTCYLVFEDSCGLGKETSEYLEKSGCHVVSVEQGEQFCHIDERKFMVNPESYSDFDELLKKGLPADKSKLQVLHFWTVTGAENLSDENLLKETIEFHKKIGYDSIISLTQAIGNNGNVRSADICLVSSNMQCVNGKERIEPGKSTILGPCRVIPKEYGNISCRSIDIPLTDLVENKHNLVETILTEINNQSDDLKKDNIVAYRDGKRWEYGFKPYLQDIALKETGSLDNKIRKNGVYLITGGLGGIGFVLAEHLAKTARAKLILSGRSELPEKNLWDNWLSEHDEKNSVSMKIIKLRQLEEMGSRVIVISADVTDAEKMRKGISEAESVFGSVNGIIHAAGIAGGGMIQQKTPQMSEEVFAPKLYGALVLYDIFCRAELDFVIFCSSLQSLMGDLGQADYCAANAFLDAFAGCWNSKGHNRITSVDWDNWQETGIAADTQVPDNMKALRREILSKAISSREGVEIFERVLISQPQQVIISAQPLQERIELSKAFSQDNFPGNGTSSGFDEADQAGKVQIKGSISKNEIQNKVADIWKKVLGVKKLGPNDNFFDLGGNSLTGLQLVAEIKREFDIQIAPVVIYEAPTISAMARLLGHDSAENNDESAEKPVKENSGTNGDENSEIAIIGMSCRFPGANNIDEFWKNLCEGVESVTQLSDEELLEAGVDPALLNNPNYVKAAPMVEGYDMFDAEFFGYNPREAEMMDPQHRLFLQCAWESLENAGYTQDKYRGLIGVFAGASLSTYMFNLYSNRKLMESVGNLQAIIGNDKDSLTTSVSYKLNLKGPSIAVQTFCSTSLVAVHLAAKSLLSGECHMALAGGATINVPHKNGYLYNEGGIFSPDGHCRAFDKDANGMLFGNGVGIVVLKRLKDALADRDSIIAVIKGSAINNDGSLKVGYTAPSVEGQSEVISNALENAGITADSIGYIEAHGTGTLMGDPIEIAALTKAFGATTENKQFCAIGSVKTNLGHLDRAAGIAGLIKAALSLKNGMIPPSLNYTSPNPKIDFENSPFFVNTSLKKWETTDIPRRAGVSALGFGGTNAHVILEEAPPCQNPADNSPCRLLLFSGRTENALAANMHNFHDYLKLNGNANIADMAYTLQVGRKDFRYRKAFVCSSVEDALNVLGGEDARRIISGECENENKTITFMFPGQGSQYPGMGQGLYQLEPVFREQVDNCCEILKQYIDMDLRSLIYPEGPADIKQAEETLSQTGYTQPAVFVIEYATAKMLCSWGMEPDAMIGHSIGEYVAAVLAGVMTLEDALMLVSARGRLIQELPGGTMLGIPLAENEITPLLNKDLSMAAVNGPEQCVVSGSYEEISLLKDKLANMGVECRELHTSHAFHSGMLEPVVEPFKQLFTAIQLHAPNRPFISCVTGTWITESQAVDPAYWAQHLRGTVLFSYGISEILKDTSRVLIEAGPGQTLSKLARQNVKDGIERCIISTIRHPSDKTGDMAFLLTALGRLWIAGKHPDWDKFNKQECRRRIPLPTYPFEGRRYWVDRVESPELHQTSFKADEKNWILVPSWKRSKLLNSFRPETLSHKSRKWLVFVEPCGLGGAIAQGLLAAGQEVVTVTAGAEFKAENDRTYTLKPERAWEFTALVNKLNDLKLMPDAVVHLWNYAESPGAEGDAEYFKQYRFSGSLSVLNLVQSIKSISNDKKLDIWVISSSTADISGEEAVKPEKAAAVGMCRAISGNSENIICRSIDVLPGVQISRTADNILAEIAAGHSEVEAAFRGRYRWIPDFEELEYTAESTAKYESAAQGTDKFEFRQKGTYFIMDGLTGMGFEFARYLAQSVNAGLVLPQPCVLPDKSEWDGIIDNGGAIPDNRDIRTPGAPAYPLSSFENDDCASEINRLWEQNIGSSETSAVPEDIETELDRLCSAYIYSYFAKNLDIKRQVVYSEDELKLALGITAKYYKFFGFMLSVLEQESFIETEGETVRFIKEQDKISGPEFLSAELLKKFPEFENALSALKYCVDSYSDVLAGRTEAMAVFSQDNGLNVLEVVDEVQQKYSNGIHIQRVISEYFRKPGNMGKGRKMRFLEINAGDDRLTWHIAEALKDKDAEYCFTSLNKNLINNARKKAVQNGWGFMKFRVLDVSEKPEEQGFAPYSFDFIVGTNAVHAQPDISSAVQNVEKLLMPGGLLLMMEATRPRRWVNLIWGLADHWWNYSDNALRTNSPLLAPEVWKKVLCDQGNTDVTLYPAGDENADHSLIVARQNPLLDSEDYKAWLLEVKAKEKQDIKLRIERLRQLEQLGGEVFAPSAAGWTEASINKAVDSAMELFGSIQGVIFTPLQLSEGLKQQQVNDEVEESSSKLEQNISALNSLEAVLPKMKPDFISLMSPDEWGLQTCDSYFLAQLVPYMSTLSQKLSANCNNAKLIQWDSWSKENEYTAETNGGYIDSEHGISAFRHIVSMTDINQIMISPRNVSQFTLEHNRPWLKNRGRLKQVENMNAVNDRPDLGSSYMEPQNETEQRILKVWQEVLGISQIGVYDSFFEIGGDSLQATQLNSRIRDQFGVELPMQDFFNAPTIGETAAAIEDIKNSREREAEAEILKMIEQLSEDEIEAEIMNRMKNLE
ncbi:type I polyketide synthase [Ruminiclostridium cellobioparum]|uniref:Phenolphthiocerol/phthiocerol polyketide synthase subunit E n=1 Tax=Ruminiclostridium cellobioparum subsp. termitidis CT1112 TaxID=1195236 RepID=S0FP06_RUMCE|nr:type I polyketide synthase [Ruminiclostridium cellobioparum]EMS73637.1 polyketide synthase like protein [Ruminiclostridium cellobioparum subsp. termitidis CT1112]